MAVILIVEDDDVIRELSEISIQEWGYDTLSASDEAEALVHLRSSQPIDALFTDINLKKNRFGGCELAIQATRLRPGLPVLYATGNFINETMTALFIAGAQCLAKPYTPFRLKASLEHMVVA